MKSHSIVTLFVLLLLVGAGGQAAGQEQAPANPELTAAKLEIERLRAAVRRAETQVLKITSAWRTSAARALVRATAPLLSGRSTLCDRGCHEALGSALITQPAARDPEVAAKLDAVAGRLLGG